MPCEQKNEDQSKTVGKNSKSFHMQKFPTPKYFKSKRCGRSHCERTVELQVPSFTQDRVAQNKGHENHKLCKEIRILFNVHYHLVTYKTYPLLKYRQSIFTISKTLR